MKALFPISLDNKSFSTNIIVPAISEMMSPYNEIIFIIADKLQLYNKAFEQYKEWIGQKEKQESLRLFSGEQRLTGTAEERRKWLDRVKLKLGEPSLNVVWHILTVDDLADNDCFDILRRVRTLYDLDSVFRRDVDKSAEDFATRMVGGADEALFTKAARMSVNYIIEELSLSIRVRVVDNIEVEYYIGKTHAPIIKAYRGEYMASVWELAALRPTDTTFQFFQYHNGADDERLWGPA